jgi:hypothetical protein
MFVISNIEATLLPSKTPVYEVFILKNEGRFISQHEILFLNENLQYFVSVKNICLFNLQTDSVDS